MVRCLSAWVLVAVGCQVTPPAGEVYYDRVIAPILATSCAFGTSGCHAADPSDPFAFAAGNLDVTSYENLRLRPDLLRAYGPYPAAQLLIKAAAETDAFRLSYRDTSHPLRIPHGGGAILQPGSPAFLTLQTWLEHGATRDGQPPPPRPIAGHGDCSPLVPPGFDEAEVTSSPQWAAYAGELDAIQATLLARGCAAQTCHGAPAADFAFTCGGTPAARAFNFHQIWAFSATPASRSGLLDMISIGSTHAGGVYLDGPADPEYQRLAAFIEKLGALPFDERTPGRRFFAERVMPVLLARGCGVESCHSPGAMNDFKLHAGLGDFISPLQLEKNYREIRDELLALEAPDPRRSRLLAKNLFPEHGGIAHRAGSLLERDGGDPAGCAAAPDTPFCVLVAWVRLEREAVGRPNEGGIVPLVYVERDASHLASPLAAAAYQPGSDLLVRDVELDAAGAIARVGDTSRSLLVGCPGAEDRGRVDVRGPDLRNDARVVVFAMRKSAEDTLHLYRAAVDGSGCVQLTSDAGVHDFDPAWSPDDGATLVFASTRAGGTSRRLGLPQSDLWRVPAAGGTPERMTFLSNGEIGPQFMRQGRVIFTTEKVDARDPAAGYYQLSGRRLNWDLTDYHPLLGQRRVSAVDLGDPATTRPSIGYQQATEIREAPDGTFVMVLSDPPARGGAGTLGIFNRSVGPFEAGRTDRGFLPSLTIPDPVGRYRSPFPLLDGRILASYAGVVDADTATALDWDLVAIEPRSGARTALVSGPGAQVEAVLGVRGPARQLYLNRRQLVFGGGRDPDDPRHAHVYLTDAPMLATLLGANLRRGRFLPSLSSADHLDVFDAAGAQVASAPLAPDGSLRVRVPAATPFYLGLSRGGQPVFRMSEEHQFGPGEHISMGVRRESFDHVCGGCHGSVSGRELDVSVAPDALTGASESLSARVAPLLVGD